MKVRFFADDFNARFIWAWVDGQHVTEDAAEIENYKGLGIRWEDVEEPTVAEKKKPGRKKKVE